MAGQRVDLLTFNGLVKINHRIKISSVGGVPTLIQAGSQEVSNNSASDYLGAREEAITTNGHFKVTVV